MCGADWLQEKVLPRIHGFYDESTFYLIRIAILNALKKLANGEVRGVRAGHTVVVGLIDNPYHTCESMLRAPLFLVGSYII